MHMISHQFPTMSYPLSSSWHTKLTW